MSANMFAMDNSPFKETMKQVHKMKDLCRCVKCGEIAKKIISTNKCEHKYCSECIKIVAGKICIICDVEVKMDDPKLDRYFSSVAKQIKEFAKAIPVKARDP